jgi:hypothetical protein
MYTHFKRTGGIPSRASNQSASVTYLFPFHVHCTIYKTLEGIEYDLCFLSYLGILTWMVVTFELRPQRYNQVLRVSLAVINKSMPPPFRPKQSSSRAMYLILIFRAWNQHVPCAFGVLTNYIRLLSRPALTEVSSAIYTPGNILDMNQAVVQVAAG